MRFVAFSAIFALVISTIQCRPSDQMSEEQFTNLTFTVDRLNSILTAYQNYKDFIPDYVWSAIESLTDEQKNQIVEAINDYHAGKFSPSDYDDLSSTLHSSYKSLANLSDSLHSKYLEQVEKLGPKGQEFATDLEAQIYSDADPDRIIWACNLFNNAKNVVSGAKSLLEDSEELAKIEVAFPEAVTFLNSKEFEAYAIVVNELKTLDCTKDRQKIFNTIKLFDKHSVMTSSS